MFLVELPKRFDRPATEAAEVFVNRLQQIGVDGVVFQLHFPDAVMAVVFAPLMPDNSETLRLRRAVAGAELEFRDTFVPDYSASVRNFVNTAARSMAELEPIIRKRWSRERGVEVLDVINFSQLPRFSNF